MVLYTQMNASTNIPAGYSTRQAASMLGVSAHEVSRLVRNETLLATKTDVGIYIIEPNSLHELAAKKRPKGRPWSAAMAWGSLIALEKMDRLKPNKADELELEELEPNPHQELSYYQKRRLHIALSTLSVDDFVSKIRNRATIRRFSCSASFIDDLKQQLVLTAVSSEHLSLLGLSVSTDIIDGYCTGSLDKLISSCHLVSDNDGKCIIRISQDMPRALSKPQKAPPVNKATPAAEAPPITTLPSAEMPPTVVAADLAESTNVRERNCGYAYLERKLDEYRTGC